MLLTHQQTARIEQALIAQDFSGLADADIQRAGLAPWVYWLEREGGNPAPRFATDFAFAEIAHRHRLNTALPLLKRWREAGIPVMAFKGVALAHSVYPSLALRRFVDVDVVIPEAFTDRVLALSREWIRVEGAIGFTLAHPSGVVTIDVHHVLTPIHGARRAEGLRLTGAAVERSLPLTIDGVDLRMPDPMDQLFFGLVVNRGWGSDRWRIKPQDYLDVEQIVRQAGLSTADLLARARTLGIARSWQVFLRRCSPFEGILDLGGRQRLANLPLAVEASLARERFPPATRSVLYRASQRGRGLGRSIQLTLPILKELRRAEMPARYPCPAGGPAVLDRKDLEVAIRIVGALRLFGQGRNRCPSDVIVRVLPARDPPASGQDWRLRHFDAWHRAWWRLCRPGSPGGPGLLASCSCQGGKRLQPSTARFHPS